jgi:hypothetical protein
MLVAAVAAAVALGVLAALVLRDPAGHVTSAGPTAGAGRASPRSTGSAPSTSGRSSSPIRTTEASYFGRPFETIQVAGRYVGVHAARTLRVELRQGRRWTEFPLPAVTRPSGRFTAYVELGRPGRYQVRLVDPVRGTASRTVTILVF